MGFKTNLSAATQNDALKPEGDYECVITAIEERTTKNGATGLNITMVIRNDVQGQRYGNACLFHTLWKRKEPTEFDMQVNGYGFGQVMALGKAAGLPDGKDYDSLKQFCEELINKPVRATVKHDEYNGKKREIISYINPTKYPDCKHQFKTSAQNTSAASTQQPSLASFESEVLSDDGVPF